MLHTAADQRESKFVIHSKQTREEIFIKEINKEINNEIKRDSKRKVSQKVSQWREKIIPFIVESIQEGFYKTFKLLLTYVNNVNQQVNKGKKSDTLLTLAIKNIPSFNSSEAERRTKRIIEPLLEKKADPNQTDGNNQSPLAISIEQHKHYDSLIMTLLEHKADVNQPNNNAETPLHLAVKEDCSSEKIIKILLEHKADPDLTNIKGEVPIDITAKNVNDPSIYQMLIDYRQSRPSPTSGQDKEAEVELMSTRPSIKKPK
jgi:ankyrin repeat protein